ncbi:hypothetical protein [Streptomyces sp. NPDC059802]|uniref:hypothetical protein n=1 Tax=Streptomyces sp. NPDC059802 TaxID=3346952 RepID=UPI0036601FCF
MGDAGRVVPGVEHDQNLRVTFLSPADGHQPLDDFADLRRGNVGSGLQTDCVQHRPGGVAALFSAATTEYGQPGTIWCLPSTRPNV